jgi:hypothetical protein
MIPWFLGHYLPLVDRIFVYDNGSTDGSVELLSGDERILVESFAITGDSFVEDVLRRSDSIWLRSKGNADWVIVLDMDEHLYHPDFVEFLKRCSSEAVTAIRIAGFQMVADAFPPTGKPLTKTVVRGVRSEEMDKFCVFDPNAIMATNFSAGRHRAKPVGNIVWSTDVVTLLHYKELGLDYFLNRTAQLKSRLRPGDISRGWGDHYRLSEQQLSGIFRAHQADARPVTGCANNSAVARAHIEIPGSLLAPVVDNGTELCFDLPTGCADFWLVIPSSCALFSGLGVGVSAISLRSGSKRQELPLTDATCAQGWWRASDRGGTTIRWTSGRAHVRLPKPLKRATRLCMSLLPP